MGAVLQQLASPRVRWVVAIVATAILLLLPMLGVDTASLRTIMVVGYFTMLVAGLNLSWGYGGELALGQVAVFAIGAYTAGLLAMHGITEVLVAVPVSAVVAGLIGLVTGLPGLRLASWSLALTSFFLILLLPDVLQIFATETGGLEGLVGIPLPTLLGNDLGDQAMYWVTLGLVVGCLLALRALVGGRYGLALKNLRHSQLLVSSLGVDSRRLKLSAYALGSIPAGFAGCVYTWMSGFLTPEAFAFTVGVAIIAGSVVGGSDSVLGAPLGATLLVLGPMQSGALDRFALLGYGLFLLVVGVLLPRGVVGFLSRFVPSSAPPVPDKEDGLAVSGGKLRVERVAKRFGGNAALAGVTLEAEPGQITAIIGPNGAGKTTLLNVVSGQVRPDDGSVTVDGVEVLGTSTVSRARLGVARTFQTPAIPTGLSALAVAESGVLARRPLRIIGSLIGSRALASESRSDRARAAAALGAVGLSELMHTEAGELPMGSRRVLEVARAAASDPKVVLFDEPAAGLDDQALDNLGRSLRRLRDAGATVLLVEHNVRFVLSLADHVHVMALGTVIASGSPDEVAANQQVIDTYLGRTTPTRQEEVS